MVGFVISCGIMRGWDEVEDSVGEKDRGRRKNDRENKKGRNIESQAGCGR